MKRWVALAVVVPMIATGALLLSTLAGLRRDLLTARGALEQAAPALASGELRTADAAVDDAAAAFGRSRARLASPVARVAAALPLLGRNLRVAGAMTDSGELIAASGDDVIAAVAALPGGVSALAPRDGVLPLEPISALNLPLERTRERLRAAASALRTSPATNLVPAVSEARRDLLARLEDAIDGADTASALSAELPAFLGADGPRRYLFGAQNPAELRGTGGVIGAFSLLTADRGRLSFDTFQTTGVLNAEDPYTLDGPSAEYDTRYRRFGAAGHASNINMTPDFPSAAAALARLHERTTGEAVDGVVVADPQFLRALLRITGPVEVPQVGRLDADGIVTFLATEQYAALADDRKETLGVVAGTVLAGFLQGEEDVAPGRALRELGVAVGRGNLLLYASDPEVEAAFTTAGIDGGVGGEHGDVVGLIANNAAGNKLDAFLDRELRYDVTLRSDGSARMRAIVGLRNAGPREGLHTDVIGPNVDRLDAGDNLTYLSLYCARACQVDGHRRDGLDVPVSPETEHGLSVFTDLLRLPSGTSTELEYDWEVADAWQPDGVGGRYELTLFHQVAIRPARASVTVRVPEGMRVADHDAGTSVDASHLRWEGELGRRVELALTFERPASQRLLEVLSRPLFGVPGGRS